MIGWCAFHGSSEVECHLVIAGTGFAPSLEDPVPKLDSEGGFCLRERLETVIQTKVGAYRDEVSQ